MDLETITREVVVRGRNEGLDDVARGYDAVTTGAERAATVVEKQSKVSENAQRALDKLRRQIDDNFKANEQMERGEQTLARSREQGIISAQEQQRQLDLLAAKYKGTGDAASAATDFSEKFNSAMLVVGRVGSSTFGALGSKVAETAARLAEGGRTIASGFVNLVGAGLQSLLSPANLLAAAFAVVTVVAVAAYSTMSASAHTLEQTLTNQTKLLEQVKQGYDAAADASKRLSAGEQDIALVKAVQQAKELQEHYEAAAKAFAARYMPLDGGRLPSGPPTPQELVLGPVAPERNFADPLNKLIDSIERGKPEIVDFQKEVAAIGRANPDLNKTANALLAASDKAAELFAKAADGNALIAVLQGIADGAQRARLGLTSIDPRETFNNAIKALQALNPNLDDATRKANAAADAQRNYEKALAAAKDFDPGQRASLENTAKKELKTTLEGINKEKKEEADAYTRGLDQVSKNIALTEAEGKAVGGTAGEHAKLRVQAQLLEAAQRAQREITPEITAQIEKYGERAKVAADSLALLQLQSRIKFDKATVFFSPEELRIAQEMQKIYGDSWPAAMQNKEAADLRAINSMKQLKDAAEGFATTLVNGLMDGQNFMVALKSAVDQLAKSMASAAIKDLMSGNFEKAGVEAVIAIGAKVASNFIDDGKAEKQLKDAQLAWLKLSDQVADFSAKLAGGTGGGLSAELRSINKDFMQLAKAAYDAKDFGAVAMIVQETIAAYTRIQNNFRAAFEGTLEAMRDGAGPDGPFASAQKRIQDLTAQVKDFVADTVTVYSDALAAQKNGIIPASGPTDASYQIRLAQEAGRQLLLTQLSGVQSLSDVASKIADLDGKTVGLQQALVDLGLSADQAAAAIANARAQGISKIAGDFVDGLKRQLNEATGRGFVNQIADLVKATAQTRADAQLLPNVDTSLVDRLFSAQAQQIVDQAQLTGQAFADLLNVFPQLTGVVHEFTTVATRSAEDIAHAQKSAQDRLFNALNDNTTLEGQLAAQARQFAQERLDEQAAGGQELNILIAAQEAEKFNLIKSFNDKAVEDTKRAEQERLTATNQTARGILDYINGLSAGSASTLSPTMRLAAAQSTYNATQALAQSGNLDAQNRWTADADNLLKAADAVYASAAGFQQIRAQIISDGVHLPAVQQATDPVVLALRNELLPAIQATTSAVGVNTTAVGTNTTAIGGTTSAVNTGATNQVSATGAVTTAVVNGALDTVGRLDTTIGKFDTTIGKLTTTVDRLDTALGKLDSAIGRLDTGNTLLDSLEDIATRVINAINGLGGLAASIGSDHSGKLGNIATYTFWTALYAASDHGQGAPSGGGGGSFGWLGFERGGRVVGGIAGRDSVPSMLMPDEYVLRRSATRELTQKYGAGVLDGLNSGVLPSANDNWSPHTLFAASTSNATGHLPVRELEELIGEMRNHARVSADGSSKVIKQLKNLQGALEAALDELGDRGDRRAQRAPRTQIRA